MLAEASVAAVVDVRTAPGSRRDPDLCRERLVRWLPACGGVCRWEGDLGGFPRTAAAIARQRGGRTPSFRGYAARARTPRFLSAMDRLPQQAAGTRTAVMRSEAVWWRCHRRLIADFAVAARGVPVRHLAHDGRPTAHSPTPRVHLRDDGLLVHDDHRFAGR
ncbi:DUF488 family protein [Streptomyces sp. Act-28]